MQAQLVQQVIKSGPLPSSEELQQYDVVVPGLANRIVTQFELEGDHRRDQERRYLRLQGHSLAIGSALYLMWFAMSFLMVETGKNVEGVVSGLVAISAMLTNVVVGYRRRN